MTPIEQAISRIEEIKSQSKSIEEHLWFDAILGILDTLLPVEQKYNCDFAEWIAENYEANLPIGYWDSKKRDKKGSPVKLIDTTTELFQLFNDKNKG